MNRNAYVTAAVMLLCAVFLVSVIVPAKSSPRREVVRSAISVNARAANYWNSAAMPTYLRWASSDAGRRALHFSSHAAAPGLLNFLGEEPTITILPTLSSEVADAPPPPETVMCNANGTQANREPPGGDKLAPFMGNVMPVEKHATSVDALPGAGLGGANFAVFGALDQRGLFGGLGGSTSLVAVHFMDKTTGTPDCTINVEAAIPSIVDLNGVTVSGISGASVAVDSSNSTIIAAGVSAGTAPDGNPETAAVVSTTSPSVFESTACTSATEGSAKNKACLPVAFSILSSEFNQTAGTGFLVQDVSVASDSAGVYTVVAKTRDTAQNDSVQVAQCEVGGKCSPFVIPATGTKSNPITSLSSTFAPNRKLLVAYSQGDPTVPLPTEAKMAFSCILSVSASVPPTCSVPFTLTDAVGNVTVVGQSPMFTVDNSAPTFASGGSNTAFVTDSCAAAPINTPGKANECPRMQFVILVSTDGGATFSTYTLTPAMPGSQYFSRASADGAGNLYITFLSTGTDATGQSFQVMLEVIPAALTAPTIMTITPKRIDPSAGFSSSGTSWSAPAVSPVRNGVMYLHFDSTNFFGNWPFGDMKQMKETNANLWVLVP